MLNLLKTEFNFICQKLITSENEVIKNKKKKIRKRFILIESPNDVQITKEKTINKISTEKGDEYLTLKKSSIKKRKHYEKECINLILDDNIN